MRARRAATAALAAWIAVAGLAGGVAAQGTAQGTVQGPAEVLATAATLAAVRAGGFVLYLRHGETDNSRPDRVPTVDLADCATQRPLNEEGRRTAAVVGAAMAAAGIPIAEIHASPMCRVRDTADAAFPGRTVVYDENLVYTSNLTESQKAPILARTRALLSTPVAGGTNRLVIAHGPNLMDLMGQFPKEGTLTLFRPRGDGRFDYVASIPADLWPALPGGR